MRRARLVQRIIVPALATLCAAAMPGSAEPLAASAAPTRTLAAPTRGASVAAETAMALAALQRAVGTLSHPLALADAFHSYLAFRAAHPDEVKKPLLYFVDYGLPSTARRGWVFNMHTLTIVDGPFTVAQGKGSSSATSDVPTRFSNAIGSDATSLGLYVTRALYAFTGRTGGRPYAATGLQLDGVSTGFNDNAAARKVVVHGAPYVTPIKAGHSEGCPAMELARASRLLPELADGGMVFLFAPDAHWMSTDPWVTAN